MKSGIGITLFLLFLSLFPLHADATSIARIESITFQRNDVFDTTNPKESAWPYHLANALHIISREGFLRSMLLFKKGDIYDPLVIAASERRLRKMGIFQPVTIKSVPLGDGNVAVTVITRDTWTLKPGISFSSYSGKNKVSVEVEESNFLGWGKHLLISHLQEEEQDKNAVFYEDHTFLAPLNHLFTGYWKTDDGKGYELFFNRPFFDRNQPFGFRLAWIRSDDRVIDYWQGHHAKEFTLKRRFALGEYTRRLWGRGAEVLRGGAGLYRLTTDNILREEGVTPNPYDLDPYRTETMPFLYLEFNRETYVKTRGFYAFEHDEDILLGPSLRVGAGRTSSGNWHLMGEAEMGWGNDREQAILLARVSNRFRAGGDHTFYLFGFNGAHHWSFRNISSFALRMDGFIHPESTELLYLDAEEGMRGADYRLWAGSRRCQITLQHKVLFISHFLELVNIGAAVFADVGKVWGFEESFNNASILKTVGVGLRVESLRSGFSTLARFDMGYDINRGGWEVSVTTGEWFDWREASYAPTVIVSPSHATWWIER